MKITQFVLFLVLVVFSASSYAQRPKGAGKFPSLENATSGLIGGRIIDEYQQAMPLATVMLYQNDSLIETTTTQENGAFRFRDIPFGDDYHISVTFLGYQRETLPKFSLSKSAPFHRQGQVSLSPDEQVLEDVVIEEKKDEFYLSLDKKVYDVGQSLVSEGGSANDILNNIPSVEVDIDDQVTLRGSENVKILIDGRESNLTGTERAAFLTALPASSIEKVEVMTNPSAKYDPEGMAGIINLVLKKNKKSGWNGSISAGYGTWEQFNTSLFLSYRTKKWNVYGTGSFRHDNRYFEGSSYRENFFSDTTYFVNETSHSDFVMQNRMNKIGIEYSINPQHKVGLTISNMGFDRTSDRDLSFESFNASKSVVDDLFRKSKEGDDRTTWDGDFNYQFNSKLKGEKLDLAFRYTYSDDEDIEVISESLFDLTPESLELNQFNHTLSTNEKWIPQLDYVRPMGNGEVELGAIAEFSENNANFISRQYNAVGPAWDYDSTLSNTFKYEEDLYAAYALYGHKFGGFHIKGGLRVEQVQTTSSLVNTNETFNNDYLSVFPSLHMSQQLSNAQEIQLSYSRRINRPRTRALNPFPNLSDPLNIRVGNPFLKPEYSHALEFTYLKRWNDANVSSSVYFRRMTDLINRIRTVNEDGSSTISYTNLDSGLRYGVEVNGDVKILDWWSVRGGANFYHSRLDGSNVQSELVREVSNYRLSLSNTFSFWKDFTLQLSGRYRSGFEILQGSISPMYHMDIAARKSLLDRKLSISLQLTDVFDTRSFEVTTSGDQFTQTSSRKRQSRIGRLTLTYRFGQQGKFNRGGNRGGGGQGDMGEDIFF